MWGGEWVCVVDAELRDNSVEALLLFQKEGKKNEGGALHLRLVSVCVMRLFVLLVLVLEGNK